MFSERVNSTTDKVTGEISLYIASDRDIITARQQARIFADRVGFRDSESAMLSTLISDVVRSILIASSRGSILMRAIQSGTRRGMAIFATGEGHNGHHGFTNEISPQANRGRNPLGLSDMAARRTTDEFEISASSNRGITVRVVKWL